MQILVIINFTAAIQGLFLAYLLFNNKAHTREYRLLALLVLVMSVAILGPVLGLSGYYRQFPHLIRVGDPLVLLFGPLLYFYIHLLTKGKQPKRYIWHLIPFVLYLIWLIPFYAMSGEEKITFGEQVFLSNDQKGLVVFIQSLRNLHVSAYIIASLALIRQFQRLLKANYSDIDKLNLDKSAFLLKLYLIIAIMSIGIYLLSFFIPLNFVLINNIIALAIAVVIYALAYFTWNRPHAIVYQQMVTPYDRVTQRTHEPLSLSEDMSEQSLQEKPRSNHNISDSEFALLAERLEQLLQKEQVYLKSDLSLNQLSELLAIPTYQTSEVISRRYQEHFFDLINRHRVEEVKKRLNDPAFSHYSILGIAMDCGFNSKSSFNTAFKKFTGLTPSQYRKQTV